MTIIDTHRHYLPPAYIEAVGAERIAAVTPYRSVPPWSEAEDLAAMDRLGIGKSITSISPGLWVEGAAATANLARMCNEYGAGLVARNAGRYGFFAALPLPDIAASLAEIAHACEVLRADGFILFTSYDGAYLGDPHFAELFSELNRRAQTVFVHPTQPRDAPSHLPAAILEFPFDTTRTIASLLFSGATLKYPDIKFIFSHAGGALPFMSGRVSNAATFMPQLAEMFPGGLAKELRKFYFDTALSANRAVLSCLREVTDSTRILFGSDYPFAPEPVGKMSLEGLRGYGFSAEDLGLVLGGNAQALFKA